MKSKRKAVALAYGLLLVILVLLATSAGAQNPTGVVESSASQRQEGNLASPVDGKMAAAAPLPDTMKMEPHGIALSQALPAGNRAPQVPAAPNAWTTITAEDFEGAFPGPGWSAFDNDGATNGEYYWGDDNHNPYAGSWSGWPANGGADGYGGSAGFYPNNARSWLVYGPFDLSDAVDAELLFYYSLDTEIDYDIFGWYASIDGSSFYGSYTSGNSGGWLAHNFDLTAVPTLGNVTGQASVWIAFIFNSDVSINDYAGPFLDDIVLRKNSGGGSSNLTPYTPTGWDDPIVPSSMSGTTTVDTLYHTQDTYIDWAVVNDGSATATGRFYTCLYLDGSEINCWYTDDLDAGSYAYVQDYVHNVDPPAGWHTLEIVTDFYDDIAESNESDNSWSADFYWDDPAGSDCAAAISEFEALLGGATRPSTDDPLPQFMPPHPDLLKRVRSGEIELPDYITDTDLKRARGIDQPAVLSAAFTGTWRALALLVEFTDNPAAVGAAFFDSLLFGTSFGDLRHYYQDVSYGTLDIVTVNLPSSIGWCLMPQTYAYYAGGNSGFGTYPQNAQRMAEDAVLLADPLVDYSQYDNDADGYVDTVFIIHAGPGAETTGNSNDIWSHSWAMVNDPLVDGVIANGYTTEPEYWTTPGDMTSGVYAHELGHAFGLPDLYDTDDSSYGVGDWSLMGGGSWNGTNGDSPAWPDAWSRYQLGYSSLTYVVNDVAGITLPAAETSSSIFHLATDGVAGSEYYLVENRQPIGYDAVLPGDGLLIWHIDDTMTGNQSECDALNNWTCAGHLLVALEQADGLWDIEHKSDQGDLGDPYPGSSDNRQYDFSTVPNSSSYYHSDDTCVGVNNISDSAANMTADLLVTCGGPVLAYDSHLIDDDNVDESEGNGDGVADCGETIELYVDLNNVGAATATGVGATIGTSDSYATILHNTSSDYPDMAVEVRGTNLDDFDIYIDSSTPDGHLISFELGISASNGGPWSDSFAVEVRCLVSPEPEIDVSPPALASTQPPDSVNVVQLDISNLGAADLDWFFEESVAGGCAVGDIPWASVAPDAGATTPGNTTTIDVTFDSTGLAEGNYTGELCLYSNDVDESLVVLPLDLDVVVGETNAWIEPVYAEVGLNGTVTVDVVVSDVVDLYGASLEIHFDPAVVEVVDADGDTAGIQVTPGTCPSPDFVVQNEADNLAGVIRYDAASLAPSPPCSGAGQVLRITFRGLASDQTSPVAFVDWLLSDTDGFPILTVTADGTVHVVDAGAFRGVVNCQGRLDHSGAEVCAWSGAVPVACTLTDASGNYELLVPGGVYDISAGMELYLGGQRVGESVTAGGTTDLPLVALPGGDASGDCNVNILDLAFMGSRYRLNCGDPGWDYRADINGDCTVNIQDIVLTGSNYGKSCPVPW